MDNYNFENSTNGSENNNQQDYFQVQQSPAQNEYVQYTDQRFVSSGYEQVPVKKKRKREIDAVVIVSLLIAVVVAVFFVAVFFAAGFFVVAII